MRHYNINDVFTLPKGDATRCSVSHGRSVRDESRSCDFFCCPIMNWMILYKTICSVCIIPNGKEYGIMENKAHISNRVSQISKSAIHEMTRLSKQVDDVAFLSWAKPTTGAPDHKRTGGRIFRKRRHCRPARSHREKTETRQ